MFWFCMAFAQRRSYGEGYTEGILGKVGCAGYHRLEIALKNSYWRLICLDHMGFVQTHHSKRAQYRYNRPLVTEIWWSLRTLANKVYIGSNYACSQ